MGRRRLAGAADHSGGVRATARGQGRVEQLEKPSSSRRESGGHALSYNQGTWEVDGRREGGGGARSSAEAG
jgi:hypothetical protein